jgi:flagellar hook-associated protein 2
MASTFNIGGLVSGLDTNSIISQLMALEQRPITLLQDKVAREENKLSVVRSIKTQVASVQSALSALLRPSSLNAKTATTDTASTAPAVLSATANSDAVNGSFKVTVSQLATATRIVSGSALGNVINRTATLGNAGFRILPITDSSGNPATFSINGKTISVDNTTTLDDGTANSVIAKINAAGANVTASLIADADGRANNRLQLVSDPGKPIQLGGLGDTSNILRVLNVADAVVQGNTAASVTSNAANAGALSTSITINGVTTAVNQGNAAFSAADNAAFIADAINNTTNTTVQATANGDGTITLQQKTLGAALAIDVTAAGADTGLVVAKTQNGTDRVVSTANLGALDLGKSLADSRLATPIGGLDASGNGQLTINGVAIKYSANDSIAAVLNRINASNAGATAFYDPTQDRIRLTASQTGARTMTLSDDTGNFLAATGLLNATQSLGQNAVFSIDSVNDGQPLTSNTNTISGYIPGVTLSLKSVSASPVTVTVGQDTGSTITAVQSFVDKVNGLLDAIAGATAYDPDTKQAATLTGDTGILGIARTLRSLVTDNAFGATGKYQSLADLGISTGKVGAKAGSTNNLVLDQTKLTNALQDNPQAVLSVLSGFTATLGAPAGAANVTKVAGTPLNQHQDGTYHVNVQNTDGLTEVTFVTNDGRTLSKTTGTLTAGVDDNTLIPGLTLTANSPLVVGETTFSMTVATRGVGVRLNDYLNSLLAPDGFFSGRDDGSQAITRSLNKQIADGNARLEMKQDSLTKQFAALETVMAQFQQQTAALTSAIAQLPTYYSK